LASSARGVCFREEPEDKALAVELGETNRFAGVAHALKVRSGVADREEVGVGHKESFDEGEQHGGEGSCP
jgi:hypothetical protein